jgi:hypothetical protein
VHVVSRHPGGQSASVSCSPPPDAGSALGLTMTPPRSVCSSKPSPERSPGVESGPGMTTGWVPSRPGVHHRRRRPAAGDVSDPLRPSLGTMPARFLPRLPDRLTGWFLCRRRYHVRQARPDGRPGPALAVGRPQRRPTAVRQGFQPGQPPNVPLRIRGRIGGLHVVLSSCGDPPWRTVTASDPLRRGGVPELERLAGTIDSWQRRSCLPTSTPTGSPTAQRSDQPGGPEGKADIGHGIRNFDNCRLRLFLY